MAAVKWEKATGWPQAFRQRRRDAQWRVRQIWRQGLRRWGYLFWLAPLCVVLSSGAWLLERRLSRMLEAEQERTLRVVSGPSVTRLNAVPQDPLKAFDANLLDPLLVPQAVDAVLQMARSQGLVVSRSEYTVHVDPVGRFTRYRMTFPVKGHAEAVHRFIFQVLQNQSAVVLKNMHLKREQAESVNIEVRTEWDFLLRLAKASTDADSLMDGR